MKLSIVYCIAFTFLGILIIYIANKLPELLGNEKLRRFFYDNNLIAITIYRNDNEGKETNDSWTPDVNKGGSNKTAYSSNELVTLGEAIREQEDKETNRNLVRKRRFLIFPEGSSLQLVFCMTYFTRIPIADIFYMGATASLAWALPQDPYSPYDQQADAAQRIDEEPVLYTDKIQKASQLIKNWGNRILVNKYTGQAIQPFAKDYYNKMYEQIKRVDRPTTRRPPAGKPKRKKHKKLFINPVFAKRSVDDKEDANEVSNRGDADKRQEDADEHKDDVDKYKEDADKHKENANKETKRKKRASILHADIEAMHREQEMRKHLNVKHMEKDTIDFHRLSRYGLYGKLEKLILGMGTNGKDCVLKTLCEVGQDLNGKQGTFLEEILRVIFTLPKSSRYHAKFMDYDEAHRSKFKCSDIYTKCSFSFKSLVMGDL